MKRLLSACAISLAMLMPASAQNNINIFHKYDRVSWKFPFGIDAMTQFDFSNDGSVLNGYFTREDSTMMLVPFDVEDLDSINVAADIDDADKGHNHYRVFTMNIATEDQLGVTNREEWRNCIISVDGKGEYSDFCGSGRIRGRGNSSWEWYDKKPYKFKLDSKSKILGLSKAKNWNLLANYRDVTDLMNTYAFEAARYMGMPNTNHTRYVEVFLDGDYIGTYQLTEKIEVAKNRVEIDETEGVMLSFDQDDGPSLSPQATDNFWSTVYNLPMCVKYPDEPTSDDVKKAKADFAVLENAVKAGDYDMVDSLMDIPSFIGILQLHEYLYNVEIDAPRSMYMYKDKGGKYTLGPVWDWDAGYDFDWSDMYTGHNFFSSYKELIYGTDPVSQNGGYKINKFFIDMFKNEKFLNQYKEAWKQVSDSIYVKCWDETQKYVAELKNGTYSRDCDRWPISGKNTLTEVVRMGEWLKNRKAYLDEVIANYPVYEDEGDKADKNMGSMTLDITCYASKGYSQSSKIEIDKSKLKSLLGNYNETKLKLVPLDADGEEGENTAGKAYGAWFGEDGSTCDWNWGHVYIESNDLYTWSYGCHPYNCWAGDQHTVGMQYRYADTQNIKTVNVYVNFKIQ